MSNNQQATNNNEDHHNGSNQLFRFSIDRGGTFCDIYAEVPKTIHNNYQPYVVMKLLSEDPQHYSDAPREGIKRIMNKVLGLQMKDAKEIDIDKIEYIRMGTTVATNALLERKGSRCALITTKGFRDLLKIGHQARPKIFELFIRKPSLLYERVIEVDERVCLTEQVYGKCKKFQEPEEGSLISTEEWRNQRLKKGISGEEIFIRKTVDEEFVYNTCKELKESGINSIAVVLLHSYTFGDHELQIAEIAKRAGIENISLSHQAMPMIRAVPRGHTTCVDAYLSPIIRDYVRNFCSGFSDFDKLLKRVTFMQSNGGLTPASDFKGCNAILSGPAGGIVAIASTCYNPEDKIPIIGIDIGGTSTDVSRFGGKFDLVFETETAGVQIQAPQLDITTVAAGGGSRLTFNQKTGIFEVGPSSVGANPGPVCYRKQGTFPIKHLAITDANLFLGRLLPEFFPKIFGETEDQPLDYEATKLAFEELTKQVNDFEMKRDPQNAKLKSTEEVAYGFIQVANEAMSRPIRSITVSKGYDTRDHTLCSFGGAGSQHAQAIANNLGMKKVFIPRQSGILSAYGLGLADVVLDEQEPSTAEYTEENFGYFSNRLKEIEGRVVDRLKNSGFDNSNIKIVHYLNLKYKGTDYSIMISIPEEAKQQDSILGGDYRSEFERAYKREYGFTVVGRPIIVDDIRVRGIGITPSISKIEIAPSKSEAKPITSTKTYFEQGWTETAVYDLQHLAAGDKVHGPAIIIHDTTTIVVEPHGTALITKYGDVEITLSSTKAQEINVSELKKVDAVRLSIFNHRFMSIAEQMGRSLQRTSTSTNIKERLDFSCALFSPDGSLLANAPHLPVHLGSMSEAVRYQIRTLGESWKEGEVIVANHPCAGGTHLPDITVITPVYSNGKVAFYVANRGHHADIGGIQPGSMPPFSRLLSEEGMAIVSCKLVENGEFQEERTTNLLKEAGARAIKDNISDMKAQVAANTKGISLLQELINEYSLEVVQSYMQYVQDNAEYAVKEMLQQVFEEHSEDKNAASIDLHSQDFMDDGSIINLHLTIKNQKHESFRNSSEKQHVAIFDFTGTSEMMLGNTNAPKAITISAILYSLRCLVKQDIPLNQGCLEPISIKIEKHSLLDIGEDGIVGVVAGNVLTSQRVTDVILKAFSAAACSQGCMNNFTFGNESWGYYETICGGVGAGKDYQGEDSVHTHMTNTRITDVEILERRYPLILKQFSVRPNSGGEGEFRGGNGVVREVEFLEPLQVGILSERRVFSPSGCKGGKDGQKGKNLLILKSGLAHSLGGKNSFKVEIGDCVVIQSPGGGGYGKNQ